MAVELSVATVESADGTRIAYERLGQGEGPPLVVVDGGFFYRANGYGRDLAPELAPRLAVVAYDRRGRGDSGDTAPYAPEREVEDLAAVIGAVEEGGPVFAVGHSSGAVLALEAALRGLPIAKLALYEPPIMPGGYDPAEVAAEVRQLTDLAATGSPGDAAAFFLGSTGMSAEAIGELRETPMWPAMVAVEHTLAYDTMVVAAWPRPAARAAGLATPTLLLDGESFPWMTATAGELAAALPAGRLVTLAGQGHLAGPTVLAPVLTEFFLG